MSLISLFDFSSPQVQAAIISGFFNTVVGGIIASIGFFISNNFRKDAEKAKKLKEKLDLTINDIHLLLKVEEKHCDRNREHWDQGYKNLTRASVRELGLSFSGKFTPGRVNHPDYNE